MEGLLTVITDYYLRRRNWRKLKETGIKGRKYLEDKGRKHTAVEAKEENGDKVLF